MTASGTTVRTCTCEHKFQDKFYGRRKRLFNRTSKEGMARCTVCKSEKSVSDKSN